MQCPACQTENDPDCLVCFTCGLALSPPVKKGTVIGGRAASRCSMASKRESLGALP